MTGMAFIDSSPERYKTKEVGEHAHCGGTLVEVESKQVRFLICKKCQKESFTTPAADMFAKESYR